MAQRLVEDCRSVDDGREFHWALSLTTFHWMRFISFGVLRSVLLVMVFFGDSTTNSVLALMAIVVAMIAEEASAERVVVAAADSEMVVFDVGFDATPGLPYFRPTAVLQRVGGGDVRRPRWGCSENDGRSATAASRSRVGIAQRSGSGSTSTGSPTSAAEAAQPQSWRPSSCARFSTTRIGGHACRRATPRTGRYRVAQLSDGPTGTTSARCVELSPRLVTPVVVRMRWRTGPKSHTSNRWITEKTRGDNECPSATW